MVETYEYYFNKYGIGLFECNTNKIHISTYRIAFSNDDFVYHRLDGPAVIYKDENSTCRRDWWINGVLITNQILKWSKDNEIDIDNLSIYDKNIIKIVWGGI